MKETKLILNTNEGQSTYKTEVLNGKLLSVIVNSEVPIQLIINSAFGYPIFKKMNQGTNYYSVRSKTIAAEENLMDRPNFEEFILNEPLEISVSGQTNTEISLILRLVDI